MKAIAFGIRSVQELMEDFEAAFEAARKRLPFKPREGVFFTSLESMRSFLTPRRLELLHAIKDKNPGSVYSLAQIVGRDFPSVLRDLQLLRRHGLVKLPKAKNSPREALRPVVDYDAINICIRI